MLPSRIVAPQDRFFCHVEVDVHDDVGLGVGIGIVGGQKAVGAPGGGEKLIDLRVARRQRKRAIVERADPPPRLRCRQIDAENGIVLAGCIGADECHDGTDEPETLHDDDIPARIRG